MIVNSKINQNDFKNIINQTFFATSLSETRPLLTGINFKLSGNMLEVIATDSYRLARKEIDLKEDYDNEFNRKKWRRYYKKPLFFENAKLLGEELVNLGHPK